MINKVRNKASPTRIWLGGDCCVPRALRRNDSTITILVKLVIIMIREGTTARNRNKNMISSISMGFPVPEDPCRVRDTSVA